MSSTVHEDAVPSNTVLVGDALETLRRLPDGIARTCVTSPPYWALRDYGVQGQLGLESSPTEYVKKLVAVFREVRRVLKRGSTLWLVLGDTYYPGGGMSEHATQARASMKQSPRDPQLKVKDLVGIPWRVALALQADGWWLRNAIVWAKPNAVPSSVRDRLACKHEYVFVLANDRRYHFDLDAVREPFTSSTLRRIEQLDIERQPGGQKQRDFARAVPPKHRARARTHREILQSLARRATRQGKNPGDVWTIPTRPTKLPHFAAFPPALARRSILAGSAPRDLVLDPFCGIGTTLIEAKHLGRRYLGIDLQPRYVRLAIEHLKSQRQAELPTHRINRSALPLGAFLPILSSQGATNP